MIEEVRRPILLLDSWPVLEWIKRREPGYSKFAALLEQAASSNASFQMSRMNYGEVLYMIRKAPDIKDRKAAEINFRALEMKVHSIDDALVDEAVELKSRYPFAFADAFAAALAIRLNVELVTGDVEFRALAADGLLRLRWVGL
jgi:ribonuclease VapC